MVITSLFFSNFIQFRIFDDFIQLMCGSGMALTVSGGVTSSVPIWTWTLWHGDNFFVFFKFHTVPYI
jgi:hypothetical protein